MYQILPHSAINKTEWDRCVSRSSNQSLYGKSWFLNQTAGSWQGIIKGRYEAVFPLIAKRKYALNCTYQPLGLPRVAWYGEDCSNLADYAFLIELVGRKMDFAHLNLEMPEAFNLTGEIQGYSLQRKQCQFLTFGDRSLEQMQSRFSKGHRYAIRKAAKAGVIVKSEIISQNFWKVAFSSPVFHAGLGYSRHAFYFEKIIRRAMKDQKGMISTAYFEDQPIASSFAIVEGRVLYWVMLFANSTGRALGANHLMISEIIRLNLGKLYGIDFGGSNINSIGYFNRGFGAEDMIYTNLHGGRFHSILTKFSATNRHP